MDIIKLDAIDSTNDFLKKLSKHSDVENFTMVLANSQTNGKGQRGATWFSESGKNVIMSVLLKNLSITNKQLFDLNVMISISILNVLIEYKIPKLSIKWPNDIMSDNKKIGGILIENTIKTDNSIISIVGIGLNVNQTNFSTFPKASSIALLTGLTFDVNQLAEDIRKEIYKNRVSLSTSNSNYWELYHQNLFKINVPSTFEDNLQNKFMAIIKNVTREGKLQLLLEDDSIVAYDIKEVKMLY